jgi:hypothetical protein
LSTTFHAPRENFSIGAWTLPQDVLRTFCTPVLDTVTSTPVDEEEITNSQVPPDSLISETRPATVRLRPSTSTPAIVTAALGEEVGSGEGVGESLPVSPGRGESEADRLGSGLGPDTHDDSMSTQQMPTAQAPATTRAVLTRL